MRFDLTSLPGGVVVTSVNLRITVTRSGSGALDPHTLHPLTKAWTEAAASWTSSGTEAWEEPGGDFVGNPDTSLNVGGVGTYTFSSSPNLIATVQAWVTNASGNNGWVLRSQNEMSGKTGRRITTREAASEKPTLTIGYTVPPPPTPAVTLLAPRTATNRFRFNFITTNGGSYRVQYKNSLSTGSWIDLTNFSGTGNGNLLIEDSLNNTQRYYQVVSP